MADRHRRLNARKWRITRRRVFERDHYRCRLCGASGRLECDHIVPLALQPDGADPYAMEGLQTLCRGCHIDKTRRENEARAAERYPARAAWTRAVAELL